MKILVIDDHPLYIDGLKSFLKNRIADLQITEASNVADAIKLFDANQFDLVLIDFKIPDMNGHDLIRALASRNVAIPLAMISGEDDAAIAKKALDLGACGFFPKSLSPDELTEALEIVLHGGEFLTPKMREQVDQLNRREFYKYSKEKTNNSHGITKRQLEVIKLIAKGYTNKQISKVLNISSETVKEHIRNIFLTLDVDNRMLCIIRAKELGLNISE